MPLGQRTSGHRRAGDSAGHGSPVPHRPPRCRRAGWVGPRLRPGRPTRSVRPWRRSTGRCLAPTQVVVVVNVVGDRVELVLGPAGGTEPPYREHGRCRLVGAIGPIHARIVRMDVTLDVILASVGLLTWDYLDSAVARNSAPGRTAPFGARVWMLMSPSGGADR